MKDILQCRIVNIYGNRRDWVTLDNHSFHGNLGRCSCHDMSRNWFKMERGVRCEGDQENEREEFGLFNLEKK